MLKYTNVQYKTVHKHIKRKHPDTDFVRGSIQQVVEPAPEPVRNQIEPDKLQPDKVQKKQRLVQMVLNFGQRNVGIKRCLECQMEYTPSSVEDSQAHTKYHKQHRKLLSWHTAAIISHVNKELGAVPQNPKDLKGFKVAAVTQIYLALDPHKAIIGCLLACPISVAFRAISNTEYDSTNPIPCPCGISRIWVSKAKRRNGIATLLYNVMAKHFIFGMVLSRSQIAFSQPTSDGSAFACSVNGDYLVYID